jgi:hypothetical protein
MLFLQDAIRKNAFRMARKIACESLASYVAIDLRNHFCPFHLGYGEGREMVNSLMLLAFEANGVIALRIMKLMRGGRSARREAKLMVSEKIHAACEATASLMAGASGDDIVHRNRRHVAANAKRLSGLNSGRSRKRVLKRARARRK